jgi:hypothetical protein
VQATRRYTLDYSAVAYKASEVLPLPDLEPELWEHIFTFLKHDQQPRPRCAKCKKTAVTVAVDKGGDEMINSINSSTTPSIPGKIKKRRLGGLAQGCLRWYAEEEAPKGTGRADKVDAATTEQLSPIAANNNRSPSNLSGSSRVCGLVPWCAPQHQHQQMHQHPLR